MTNPSAAAPLPWPPPALEPIHGKLWPAIAIVGLGDLVLVPPLLVSLGTPSPPGSLGPFGDAFWVPLATTVLGTIALLAGLQLLFRLLRNAAYAARHGHGWRTVLQVAADEPRDTGFLLVGARAYSTLSPGERDTILAARLYAAGLVLAAVLLMPLGLGLVIVLGRLGWAGPPFLWTAVSVVPLLLLLGGILGNGAARLLGRSARRPGPRTAIDPEVQARVREWNERLMALHAERPAGAGAPGKARAFSLGAVGIILLALVAVVPVVLLTLGGTVGSILATIAIPRPAGVQTRIAAAEVLRRYRLDPDPAISPETAGEALQALVWTGRAEAERPAGERKPVRTHAAPWWPADEAERFGRGPGWTDSLFLRARRLRGESGYLRRVAAHPAHAEFATAARAAAADIIGTRYELPFAEGLSMMTLSFPPFGSLRQGAQAHVAKAAVELAEGRPERAEQTHPRGPFHRVPPDRPRAHPDRDADWRGAGWDGR